MWDEFGKALKHSCENRPTALADWLPSRLLRTISISDLFTRSMWSINAVPSNRPSLDTSQTLVFLAATSVACAFSTHIISPPLLIDRITRPPFDHHCNEHRKSLSLITPDSSCTHIPIGLSRPMSMLVRRKRESCRLHSIATVCYVQRMPLCLYLSSLLFSSLLHWKLTNVACWFVHMLRSNNIDLS